jgi:hypothetical protein
MTITQLSICYHKLFSHAVMSCDTLAKEFPVHKDHIFLHVIVFKLLLAAVKFHRGKA